jgi:hypothetical protein
MKHKQPRKLANQLWSVVMPGKVIPGLAESEAWHTFLRSGHNVVLMHGDVPVAERKTIKVDDTVKC